MSSSRTARPRAELRTSRIIRSFATESPIARREFRYFCTAATVSLSRRWVPSPGRRYNAMAVRYFETVVGRSFGSATSLIQ
ncbi:MAG: hypothetical protein BGP03_27175 [Pseudonocardia sp. 73-21]|nr:MAG: hypothetical protein BGP03_27175 [Pseudonocardia sp. 73-21]